MPAPRNIEELKKRTLDQVAALKAKNVKVSGRGIFEFMSSGNLTGPPHRDIAAKMPGPAEITRFKGKGVKVSGPKINEYLSGRDLTGPSHRNIMKSTPGRSMINNFKEKRQPHYNNISALLALNTFIGVHAKC